MDKNIGIRTISTKSVKTKKEHKCFICLNDIILNENAISIKGVKNNKFESLYMCKECNDLEINKHIENNIDKTKDCTVKGTDYKKDSINPPHYKNGKIEVIDYIEDKQLNYNLGNAVKYISRAGKKHLDTYTEDLKKAIWYLEREIINKDGA